MRAVLRPIVYVLIALTAIVAVAVALGRIAIASLPRAEARINAALAPAGVEVTGLDGRWHLLNPVVEAQRVKFTGGLARGVIAELDVLESALHREWIVRHLSAEQIEIAPLRDQAGRWSLGGKFASPTGGGGLGIGAFLRYSDGIRFPDVRVAFSTMGDSAESLASVGALHARLMVSNAGMHHSGELVVDVERGGSGRLRLAYDLEDALFGRPTHGDVVLDARQLVVDPAFGLAIGGIGAAIDTLDGRWSFSGPDSTGRLGLDARSITLPGGTLDALDLAVRGSTGRFGRRWDFAIDRLGARGSHGEVRLDGASAMAVRGLVDWDFAEIGLPAFDAQPMIGLIRDAFGSVHGVEDWLGSLAPRGRVDGAHARYTFSGQQLDYVADVAGLALENAKGVPYVRNGNASIAGTEHSVRIHLDAADVDLGFLDFYAAPTRFERLTGNLLIWFSKDYLAVVGSDLAGTFGGSTINGSFGFGRPPDPLEQRLLLGLRIRNIDGRAALGYVPRELPRSLIDGLDQAIVTGYVDEADVVYHGHLRTLEGVPMRQVELRVDLHDAVVRFHPDWPAATGVIGSVEYTTRGTTGEFEAGNLAGVAFAEATVFLPPSADSVEFRGTGTTDGAALRNLIDTSPLSHMLSFVKPDWQFAGAFAYAADLSIPIAEGRETKADLTFDLEDLTVGLTDVGLELGALRGPVHYRYPNQIDGALTGTLFENPAKFTVTTQDDRVRIAADGHAAVERVAQWRGLSAAGIASGEFDYTSELGFRPGSEEPPVLAVQSNLVGVSLALPDPLGKDATVARPSTLSMTFGERNRMDVRLGDVAQGWLRFNDAGVRSGSLGIGVAASAERGDEDAVTIEGEIASLDLTDHLGGGQAALYPSFAWGFNALRIKHVTYRSIAFDDVTTDVWNRAAGLEISVTSPDLEGSMIWPHEGPPRLDVHYVKLPAAKPPDEPISADGANAPAEHADPLAHVDPRDVIDIDVNLQSIKIGDEDFGSWKFDLRKSEFGAAIDDLVADVKGLHIESPNESVWSFEPAHTRFKGRLHAQDLAKVLPQWNYAPSVETSTAALDADVTWPGSPLNFALRGMVGKMTVKAEKGRFVDMGEGSGAMRVFSLLNFATIAKRMTLEFSDVFGKGISFDEIQGTLRVDKGVIEFVDPLAIDGTGGDFRFTGIVDLVNGTLDNEMVVTLPVSSSLPWYAAYLGFVNPIAAGAVLVGERLFRNQIDKFSSAKYKVTGTLQNPEVNFEQVFPKALAVPSHPTPAGESSAAAPEAAPTSQPAPSPPGSSAGPNDTSHDAPAAQDKDA